MHERLQMFVTILVVQLFKRFKQLLNRAPPVEGILSRPSKVGQINSTLSQSIQAKVS